MNYYLDLGIVNDRLILMTCCLLAEGCSKRYELARLEFAH